MLFQLRHTFPVDPAVLEHFLQNWPRDLRVSFEFRHASWFMNAIYELLRHHEAGLCLETDEMTPPEVLTVPFIYLRLHRSHYTDSALRKLGEQIDQYAERGEVFAFFRRRQC